MINNRQNGRRGRGRNNNPRPQGGGGGGPRAEQGNRIDNRSRGNAAQLHEKYKTLARDAQMQGDRVMTEYYLQFADHYFRVLSEGQRRFDEQRPRQDAYGQTYQDEGEESDEAAGEDGFDEPRAMQPRREDGRQDGGRQDGGRQDGARQDGNRPNAARQNENRRDGRPNDQGDARQNNDGRQYNDGRQNNESRQNEGRPNERTYEGRREDNRPGQREDGRPDRGDRYTQDRAPRQDRGERPDRGDRQPRVSDDNRRVDVAGEAPKPEPIPAEPPVQAEAQPAPVPTQSELGYEALVEAPRPRRGRPPKVRPDAVAATSETNGHVAEPVERFDMAVLPPSIAPSAPAPVSAPDGETTEEGPRRRRTRRPRVETAENDASDEAAA